MISQMSFPSNKIHKYVAWLEKFTSEKNDSKFNYYTISMNRYMSVNTYMAKPTVLFSGIFFKKKSAT